MSETVKLKTAGPGDGAGILALLRRVAKISDAVMIPHLDELTSQKEDQNLKVIDQQDDCLVLLAELGDRTIGLLTIMPPSTELTKTTQEAVVKAGITSNTKVIPGEMGVVVDKPYWHQGVGGLLVDEGQYWLANFSHLDLMMLTVFDDNLVARKLYQHQGFVELGSIKEDDRPARLMVWIPED